MQPPLRPDAGRAPDPVFCLELGVRAPPRWPVPQFWAGLSAARRAHAGLPCPPARRFKAVSAKSKEDLVSQGFTEFTIEDFHNTVSPAAPPPAPLSARVEVGWPGRG